MAESKIIKQLTIFSPTLVSNSFSNVFTNIVKFKEISAYRWAFVSFDIGGYSYSSLIDISSAYFKYYYNSSDYIELQNYQGYIQAKTSANTTASKLVFRVLC